MSSLIQTILSVLESHQISRMQRVADYTAGRESHPAPKNLFLSLIHIYVVEAHFEMTPKAVPGDNEGKFKDIIMRRLRRGECYHQPYFGCREFPARFALYEEEEVDTAYDGTERDLGYMLYDLDYSDTEDIKPMFFRAVMKDGVLDVRNCEVVR